MVLLYFCVLESGGGHRGTARGSGGRQQGSALRFDGEFDFETSNAQFDKDKIEKELKEKLTIGILPEVEFQLIEKKLLKFSYLATS